MPSARIHEVVAKEINKDYHFDELLLRMGTVAPDSWRNVEPQCGVKDKYLTHFWNFKIKTGQANDYVEFYLKYYDSLLNPFYFGYLLHLITDQYFKTYIDPKFETEVNGIKGYILKDGSFHDDKNWYGYYESLKLQKQLARIYNLGLFPINREDLNNFECNIDELNLNGLFGNNGTLNYINTTISPTIDDIESELYDTNEIIKYIKETVIFIKKELKRLEKIKEDDDKKIKIAVDIDDTILCTKELEEYYLKEYLLDNPNIDPNKNYKWGDVELAEFWSIYREKMAFGKVKDGVKDSLNLLLNMGYRVDLLSVRPLEKYASLKKKMVEYFELNDINYNYINLGFYSKKDFLMHHNYTILIDNDIRYINEASEVGVIPILYGLSNLDYDGYQTNNWSDIPILVKKIIKKE